MNLMLPSMFVACLAIAATAAEPAKVPDLSCELSGSYTGNAIGTVFDLKIGPAAKPNWAWTSSDDPFGKAKAPRVYQPRGTYEIDGDLAVFTSEPPAEDPKPEANRPPEMRFGLNFGFPDGKIAFNHFFPDADGGLTRHRKWFRKARKVWLPAEERRLTLNAPPKEDAKTWEVVWKGSRSRWGSDGKRVEEPVDVRLTYKLHQTDWYRLEATPEAKWAFLPGDLVIQRVGGKVVSLRESNLYIDDLRGFHPLHAELPPPTAETAPVAPPKASLAPEKATVFAVAKVGGRTKMIDGQLFHLVAIRLNPFMLSTGSTNSVLAVDGPLGKWAVEEADPERALEDTIKRYKLRWMRLPDEGVLEVVWGSLTYPVEKEGVLRDRLVKSGYVPFRVDLRKLPVVEAGSAKELLAALDELAKRRIVKPDPEGGITAEVRGRLVHGSVRGEVRKSWSVTVKGESIPFGAVAVGEPIVLDTNDGSMDDRFAALEGKLVVVRGRLRFGHELGNVGNATTFYPSGRSTPAVVRIGLAVESIEEAK